MTAAEIRRAMEDRLKEDPSFGDALAERIMRSSIASEISSESNPDRQRESIRKWIDDNNGSAASLAVGLAKDDAAGSNDFESSLKNAVVKGAERLDDNPKAKDGLYGRLKRSSRDSKLLKNDELMRDEEKREILKTLFEGTGADTSKIITYGATPEPDDKGAVGAGNMGLYDRLAGGNLKGYSPQLLALQSHLNGRRPPGAPALVATGRLDYETLSYPRYQMGFDLGNMEKRLVYERNVALARLLGRERSMRPEELADPATTAKLEAKAAGRKPPGARLERRAAALANARAAVSAFENAAAAARDPEKITRGLLLELGSKQQEAARWITVAALEEELAWTESQEAFMSPELSAAIDACPVPDGARRSFRKRGDDYKKKLAVLKATAEEAVAALQSDAWLKSLAEVDKKIAANAALKRGLGRNVGDYATTAFRLAPHGAPKPRWKAWLEDLILRFGAGTSHGKRLAQSARERSVLTEVFHKIASGDLDAAHRILAAVPAAG